MFLRKFGMRDYMFGRCPTTCTWQAERFLLPTYEHACVLLGRVRSDLALRSWMHGQVLEVPSIVAREKVSKKLEQVNGDS